MSKDALLLIYVNFILFLVVFFGKPKIDTIFVTNKNNYIKL